MSYTIGDGMVALATPHEMSSAFCSNSWQGFRSLRVARVDRESASVVSLSFEAADGSSLPAGLPGQFLVLRLWPKPNASPILRNYSMSGRPGADAYRVSVKQEVNGCLRTSAAREQQMQDA